MAFASLLGFQTQVQRLRTPSDIEEAFSLGDVLEAALVPVRTLK